MLVGLPVAAGVYLLACRSIDLHLDRQRAPPRTSARSGRRRNCPERVIASTMPHAQDRRSCAAARRNLPWSRSGGGEHGFDGQHGAHRPRAVTPRHAGALLRYQQDIIIAALRLILRRIDERLARPAAPTAEPDLLRCSRGLPVDEHRAPSARSGPRSGDRSRTDKRLKRINTGCTASTCVCSSAAWRSAGRSGRSGQPPSANRCCARWSLHQRTHASAVPTPATAGAAADRAAALAGAAAARLGDGTPAHPSRARLRALRLT